MNKIITRCFQRGGVFSNAYRFLAKSALTAFALIAATFTANAADSTIDAKSGITATTDQKNLLQTGADGGTVTVQGSGDKGLTVSFDADTKFTTHIVFDGGVHTVSSSNGGGPNNQGYSVCDNSSDSNPMWLVKTGTTLNFTGKDFGGWHGTSLAGTCVIAVEDGGIINLVNQSGQTFFNRNRWLLNPGATMNLNSENGKFNIIGGTESGKEQLYVPAGSGTATIGRSESTGTLRLPTEATAGAAAYVGAGAILAVNVPIDSLANVPFVKRGAGTIQFNASVENMTGSVTVEAGTLQIAYNSSLRGDVTVTNGTITTTGGNFIIGYNGSATATIGEGGLFDARWDVLVGNNNGGGGSSLAIDNGGVVKVGGSIKSDGTLQQRWFVLRKSNDNTTPNAVNLNAGGRLEVYHVKTDGDQSIAPVLNFNGGTLYAYKSAAGENFIASGITANVLAGGAIFDINQGAESVISTTLASGVEAGVTDGGLTKRGDGSLTVEVTPTYNGTTKVEAGSLYLPNGFTPDLDSATTETTSDKAGYKKYVKNATVAKATIEGEEQEFVSIAAAFAALGGAGTVTLIADCPGENVSLAVGQIIVLDRHTIGTVSAASGAAVGLLNGIYTAYVDTTPETWTGNGGDNRWKNAANWSLGFVPLKTTPVTIPAAGATIAIASHDQTETCASLVLNGNLTLTYASPTNDGGWPVLYFYESGVSGTGTLTLNRACLNNQTASAQTISAPLVVAVDSRGDSSLLGASGWRVSGNFTVNDGAYLVVRDGPLTVTGTASIGNNATLGPVAAMTFNGATTLNGNFTRTDGYANVTFNGDVAVFETTAIPDNNDMHAVFNGAVTVAAGKTLTMPAGRVTFGDDASFKLAGTGSTIVDGTKTLTNDEVFCTVNGYLACNLGGTWVVGVKWTGGADDGGNWNTAGNWSNGDVPDENTVIAFPSDATVKLNGAARNCKGMVVDGNVKIVGGTTSQQIILDGDVFGSGTLTMSGSGLKNNKSGTSVAVAVDVVFEYNGTEPWVADESANGMTLTGNVTFKDQFKAWNKTHTIAGTTTLPGPTFNIADGSGLTLGAVIVPENATVTVSRQLNTTLTFNGTTTIKAGATLTIPNDNRVVIGNNAKFVLELGAKLNPSGNASITANKVSGASGVAIIVQDGVYTAVDGTAIVRWTGGSSGGNWSVASNWSGGYVPVSTTPVEFNNGDKVRVDANCDCGNLTINGAVEFTGAGGGDEVQLYGSVDGNGTLTLSGAGIKKQGSSDGIIAETVSVVFKQGINNANAWLAKGMTVKGSATIADGYFVSWDGLNKLAGTTTFTKPTFQTTGGGSDTEFGPIHVTSNLAINEGSTKITLNGVVAIDAGATLKIASSTKVVFGDNVSFVLAPGAMLIDLSKTLTSEKVSCSDAGVTLTATDTGKAMVWSSRAITWTGGAGDGKWSTGGNWDAQTAPTAADTVIFNNSEAVTVTADGNNCAAGALVFNGSAPVTLDGGTLNAGFVNVKNSSAFVVGNDAILNAQTLVGSCTANNVGLTIDAGGYAKFADPIECGYGKLNVSVNGTLECEGDITVGSTEQNCDFGVSGNTGTVIAKGFFKIGNKLISCYVPHYEIGADGLGSKSQNWVLMFCQDTDVRALADFEIIAPKNGGTPHDWGVSIRDATTFTINTEDNDGNGHMVTWGSGLNVKNANNTTVNPNTAMLAKTGKGTLVLKNSCVDPLDTKNTGTGFTKIHAGGTYVYGGTLELNAADQLGSGNVILAGLDAIFVDNNNYVASEKVEIGVRGARMKTAKDGSKTTYWLRPLGMAIFLR